MSKETIVIIEDDEIFRRGLARIFSDDGFAVIQCSDGEKAIAYLKHILPHLVLCDYRLPGVDGFEVSRQLQQHNQQIPFILMTAYYTEQLIEAATAQGIWTVVEKPFELEKFKKLCVSLLDNRKPDSQRSLAMDSTGLDY